MNHIKTINWILTYKCNLKCKHCDIRQNPNKQEPNINQIEKIITSPTIQQSYKHHWQSFDIWISWWEPLLIPNLEDIMLTIDKHLPWSIHSITTNATLKQKLIKLLIFWKQHWKQLNKINISIDWNEENHDKQRWTKWSFKKTIETIKTIKKIFPNQLIEIKLTITTKDNHSDILFLSKLADKLWTLFSFKPIENMTNYTNQNKQIETTFSPEQIEKIQKQIINNPYLEKQNTYKNKNFFYKIPNYLTNWLWEERKNCTIANDSITIMPDGKIYTCILMNKIGNITKQNIDEIWNSEEIQTQRKNIKQWKCPWCMLMCWLFKSKNTYEQ